MIFTRTVSGLNNQHLFHNVDFVIYVEGGISYSKQEIDNGLYNDVSIDSIFWNKILNQYKPARYKFKAIGSKTVVLKMAEDIINHNLTNVLAAMDQEFDMIQGTNINHPNVLYTNGYSWENDVWNCQVIAEVIHSFSAQNINISIVESHFTKFLKEINFSVCADAYLFSKGQSYFPRPGHMRIIECNPTLIPSLKKAEVETLFNQSNIKKSTVYAYARKKSIVSKKNCYGHLLGDYCKQLIKFLLRTLYNINGIGDEVIRRNAITCFLKYLEPNIDLHYNNIA